MSHAEKICRACGHTRPAVEEFCPYCTSRPLPAPPRQRDSASAVDTYLETRWGGGPENPSVDELRSALAELAVSDEEHPDTWLTDQNGWCVIVNESGLVMLTNDSGDCTFRRTGVSNEQALELWLLLQRGKVEEIQRCLSA